MAYPPRRTLFDLLAAELSGGGRTRGAADLVALAGAADRRAIRALTAPLRLFRRGEPLALMPFGFVN